MAEVYHIKVTGEFYVLADDYQDAMTAGSVLTDGFRHELPVGSETDLFAYRIVRQDDEFRRRCVNFEDRPDTSIEQQK
jgi:hypothetical protein